jgi:hypothetical protein
MRINVTTMLIIAGIIGIALLAGLIIRYSDFGSDFGLDFAQMAEKFFGGMI